MKGLSEKIFSAGLAMMILFSASNYKPPPPRYGPVQLPIQHEGTPKPAYTPPPPMPNPPPKKN